MRELRAPTKIPDMIKLSQIFSWDQEPVDERPSEFMDSTHLGALSGYHPVFGLKDAATTRAAPLDPAAKREPPSPRDHELSAFAREWAESLPEALCPLHLCARHPRIANRLALCSADASLTNRLLEGLLTDRRGGRAGFVPEVAQELKRLRADALRRLPKNPL